MMSAWEKTMRGWQEGEGGVLPNRRNGEDAVEVGYGSLEFWSGAEETPPQDPGGFVLLLLPLRLHPFLHDPQ